MISAVDSGPSGEGFSSSWDTALRAWARHFYSHNAKVTL